VDPNLPVATVVEYQGAEAQGQRKAVALVEPAAMRALIQATQAMSSGHAEESLQLLDRAESLQVDTSAVVFRNDVAGKRHYVRARALLGTGDFRAARIELEALLDLFPNDVPGRLLLATVDSLLSSDPKQPK
jgi:hypothetical protein